MKNHWNELPGRLSVVDEEGESPVSDGQNRSDGDDSIARAWLWPWARSRVLAMATLVPILAAIYYASFWLRYEGKIDTDGFGAFSATLVWFLLLKLALFATFRIHSSWSRFVTFYDLVALVKATTTSVVLAVLINRFLLGGPIIPRSVFVLDWALTLLVVGGARAAIRMFNEHDRLTFLSSTDKVRALIVGANDGGEMLLRAIRRSRDLQYHVVGFLDTRQGTKGLSIAGIPVVGTIEEVCPAADRLGVSEILIADDRMPGRQIRKLVESVRQHHLVVKVLPSYEQVISQRVALAPRPLSIEDLLRRESVHLDLEDIRQWIDDRVLLVTGSAGSIGSEICRQLLRFSPRRLVMLDRAESGQFFLEREVQELAGRTAVDVRIANVLDETRMRQILLECRPDVVFHAAAYKHVPLMESHPGEAVKNIVLATRRLADLAMECNVGSFVMVSTDKAVRPTSVMGACKRAAELYVQSQAESSSCRFVTVRFGNVLDSAGSVVQVFREQIARGGPVTVTDPRIERYFMTIPEAARLVVQAGVIGRSGEILLLDMGEPMRIVDLAADMIRLSGFAVGRDIEIQFTGLRPGEKLFEELHVRGETPLPTRHPKIAVVDRARRNPLEVIALVNRLIELAEAEPEVVVDLLGQLVPSYAQNRSAEPLRQMTA